MEIHRRESAPGLSSILCKNRRERASQRELLETRGGKNEEEIYI